MMNLLAIVATLLVVFSSVSSFSAPPAQHAANQHHLHPTKCLLKATEQQDTEFDGSRRKRKCSPCPEPASDDIEIDRREAAFAMLGSLWAVGAVPLFQPQTANAAYGDDAKMSLPNVVGGMADRVNKQCIVESLGNRECLLYMDPANKLYQGVDAPILLQRLETSSSALATIPELVESKNWSKVIGVMTGPMGSLSTTMDQLIKVSDNRAKSTDLARLVKTDLYAIAASADKKQGDNALDSHQTATTHLVEFVESL